MPKQTKIGKDLEDIYRDLHNDMSSKKGAVIVLSHFGEFSQDLVNSLSEGLEQIIITNNVKKTIIKRMFSIMIEGLQNIRLHGAKDDKAKKLGHVIVLDEGDHYSISLGNLIDNKKIGFISEHLDKLNAMETEEVKQYYMKVLSNGLLSEKGGAGLGFITMSLKSKSKLTYQFYKCFEDCSYFEMNMKLDYVKK
jgi:hypothetical protein